MPLHIGIIDRVVRTAVDEYAALASPSPPGSNTLRPLFWDKPEIRTNCARVNGHRADTVEQPDRVKDPAPRDTVAKSTQIYARSIAAPKTIATTTISTNHTVDLHNNSNGGRGGSSVPNVQQVRCFRECGQAIDKTESDRAAVIHIHSEDRCEHVDREFRKQK